MASGYNIAALAARTGIAPDTLRKWEQRYGILRPTRTSGGQRRYDDRDVVRVEWLKARLAEGFRIGEAAALLGAGEETPSRTSAELRLAIVAAAGAPDPDALARLLDQAFSIEQTETALRDVVAPVLRDVGELWASGAFSVAQEHLVTAAIRSRLERRLADARGGVRGVAVLACAPGERHELGLMMFGVLMRADGWQIAYLGADTPFADAVALAGQLEAPLLCVSVAMTERVAALEKALRRSPLPKSIALVVGGAAVSEDDASRLGARFVDGDLVRAIKALRKPA